MKSRPLGLMCIDIACIVLVNIAVSLSGGSHKPSSFLERCESPECCLCLRAVQCVCVHVRVMPRFAEGGGGSEKEDAHLGRAVVRNVPEVFWRGALVSALCTSYAVPDDLGFEAGILPDFGLPTHQEPCEFWGGVHPDNWTRLTQAVRPAWPTKPGRVRWRGCDVRARGRA